MYFVIVKGAIVYKEQTLWNAWLHRIAASPVEYGMTAAGIAGVVYLTAVKRKHALIPFAVYLFLALCTLIRNTSPVPTYASSFVAVGLTAGGISLAMILEKRKRTLAAVLSAVFVCMFIHMHSCYLPGFKSPHSEIITDMNAFIKKEGPARVLASRPELSMLHYYFTDMTVDSYTAGISFREQEIREIRESLAGVQDYDGVVYYGINGREVETAVSEFYRNEPVMFTRPGCVEQGMYFRLLSRNTSVQVLPESAAQEDRNAIRILTPQ